MSTSEGRGRSALDSFSLQGRTALVTGGARGLGFEIAKTLADAGAITLIAGRDAARLERAVTAIRRAGGRAGVAPFDVGDFTAGEKAIDEISTRHSRLDILVNNVGQRDRRPVGDFAPDDVRRLLDVNLVAPFALARAAARPMVAAGYGRIINVTSIAGPIARAGDAAYTASKGGLAALTRALAAELGPAGVTVNGIAPGYFATEANTEMVEDPVTAEWLRGRASLGRWGRPEEIGGAALFLASEAGSYVTGQIIIVDGGMTARF